MKTRNSLFGIIISVLLSVFFISGCGKDNPVNPPPPPPQDTADVYDWSYIHTATLTGLYVYDTNNIYTSHENGMISWWDGKGNSHSFNFNDPMFYCSDVDDYGNVIYFAGIKSTSTDTYIPCIKKVIDNNVVASFEYPQQESSSVWKVLAVGYDKLWLTQWYDNRAYYFENGTFKKYELDSGMKFSYMHQDKYGNTYLFSHLVIFNPPTPKYSFRYSYKFQNDEFNFLCKDSVRGEHYYRIFYCGDDIVAINNEFGLDYFTGNNWIAYLKKPNIDFIEIGGSNKDSLFCFGYEDSYYQNGYVWNGNSLKKEKKLREILYNHNIWLTNYPIQIYQIDNNVYLPLSSDYLFIGRKKQNLENFKIKQNEKYNINNSRYNNFNK